MRWESFKIEEINNIINLNILLMTKKQLKKIVVKIIQNATWINITAIYKIIGEETSINRYLS